MEACISALNRLKSWDESFVDFSAVKKAKAKPKVVIQSVLVPNPAQPQVGIRNCASETTETSVEYF